MTRYRCRTLAAVFADAVCVLVDEIQYDKVDPEFLNSRIAACRAAAAEYNRMARRLTLECDRLVTP